MRIAFCVEGSADRAIIHGLRDRWCPQAQLIEGRFRGQIMRSQIANECRVLANKGADLIVFLRDANDENWREVLQKDEAKCPGRYRHLLIFGVCDRNAECWLAADPAHLASQVGGNSADFTGADPSPAVKRAFGLVGFDKSQQEPRVARYVQSGPLGRWLRNRSFRHFYEQVWQKSKEIKCSRMENLQDI